MQLIMGTPAVLRLILVFILVLICIRKKLSLGNSFIVGALAMSLLFKLPFFGMIRSVAGSVTDIKTLSLALVVSLILVLSNSMEMTGPMERHLDKFSGLVSSPSLNLIVFPALIGLLPMPGGAVFSAPMVKKLGNDSKLSPDRLSFVNYWFRHIWEYWWPVYPGVLLAAVLADFNILSFVLIMFPLTLVAVSLGSYTLKGIRHRNDNEYGQIKNTRLPFILELTPILIVIFPGFVLGMLFSAFAPSFPIANEAGLILALCAAIVWVWHKNSVQKTGTWQMLKNPQIYKLSYMIIAILIFKGILEDSHAVEAITRELLQIHVPLLLIMVLLPFLIGVFTGITVAFVGCTFPILIPLVHAMGDPGFMQGYVMIAMVSGFSGVLLSPLHLCLLLSNEYFETTMGSVYRHLFMPCILLICSCLIYFYVLSLLFHWI
jgi:integral membrane protein (TIGR00529 family)